MRFSIRHETTYRYTAAVIYTIQTLRLTPRADAHQHVFNWQIEAPGSLQRSMDAFSNIIHTLTLHERHAHLKVVAHGEVEILPLQNGLVLEHRLSTPIGTTANSPTNLNTTGLNTTGNTEALVDTQGIPVTLFLRSTALTQSDSNISTFARDTLPAGIKSSDDILHLARTVNRLIKYQPGATEVSSTAREVLKLGRGVCQDHAHLMLACARSLGQPARYVSGYLYTEAQESASHAWVDIWLPELGWISVDATHCQFASDHHCRLAVGQDYESAGPMRGVRSGGGHESMKVDVSIVAYKD